ncbi:hypothetical protein Vadar_019584 [Vaccinium darrowii]|uniref:Uncharacterized protein n=1 Tax=Vaccinium darrowii TaxID=229202 RepID=A0ACB7X2L1_9ERIC|nr:hypothetical protein Vadar_019584 [Vaccinium darrowii]
MVGVEKSEIHGGRGRREEEREKKREERGAYKGWTDGRERKSEKRSEDVTKKKPPLVKPSLCCSPLLIDHLWRTLRSAQFSTALSIASNFVGKDENIYRQIRRDNEMNCAVKECYETLKYILEMLVLITKENWSVASSPNLRRPMQP